MIIVLWGKGKLTAMTSSAEISNIYEYLTCLAVLYTLTVILAPESYQPSKVPFLQC